MDTLPFWAAGLDNLSGHWQSLWYHEIDVPAAREFTDRFIIRFGYPPENQAWGDYVGTRIVLQTIAETKSTNAQKIVAHLEKGAEFDLLKARKGTFRRWDHQLLQEMYVVKVKNKANSKNRWDIFDVIEAVPGAKLGLEAIQPTKSENACTLPAA